MNNPLIENDEELRDLLAKTEEALAGLKRALLEPNPADDPQMQASAVRFAIGFTQVPLNLMYECLTHFKGETQ